VRASSDARSAIGLEVEISGASRATVNYPAPKLVFTSDCHDNVAQTKPALFGL
jgi:hypothetical protein